MELLPNSSKHVKDVKQADNSGYANSQGKRETNANLAVKPIVNFNLSPVLSFHPHQTLDPSGLDNQNHFESKPQEKAVPKAAVNMEPGKRDLLGTPVSSPVEKDNAFQHKSKIPFLSCSTMSEEQLNRKGLQKSPNLQRTPALSPKTLSNSSIAENPGNLTVNEREKSEVHKDFASSGSNLQANKSLKVNSSHISEAEISHNARSPTTSVRQIVTEESKSANQIPALKTNMENQRDATVLLGTKNSKSPKTSTERKSTGATTKNASRPKENVHSKESGTASSSKPQSKDTLDSKSGSVSKTSVGSKDSSDVKTGSGSNSKPGKGSRDGLSKTAGESTKLRPVLHTSKSAAADLSLPLPISPKPISAKRSPGSAPKTLGPGGPSREAQRSPGAARGW